MKATKVVLLLLAIVGAVACKYDDDALWDKVNSLDDRVSSIEKQLSQSNSEIQAIKTITDALQNKVYVKSVTETAAGYEILFTDGTKASIANGKDGKDGQNGQDGKEGDTPFIGEDGNWWIGTTNTGVQAKGEDGKDGQNGEDGKDGQDGQNGLTPFIGEDGNWWIGTTNTGVKATGTAGQDAPVISIKKDGGKYYWVQVVDGVESWLTTDEGAKIPVNGADAVAPLLKVNARGYWMISYDGGITYTEMKDDNGRPVKASGKNGSDGTDGTDGDSFFRDVQVMNDKLVLVLANGQILVVDMEPMPLQEYILLTEGLGNADMAILSQEGINYFYEFQGTNNNIPQRLSLYDPEQDDVTLTVSFNEQGLPTTILTTDFTIVLGNHDLSENGNTFDAVIIADDGQSTLLQNLELEDYTWQQYLTGLESSTFARAHSHPYLKWTNAIVGAVGCGLSIPTTITGVGVALAAISCGSAIVSIADAAEWIDLSNPTSTGLVVLTHYANIVSCAVNPANALSCLVGLSSNVLNIADLVFNWKEEDINLGEGSLISGKGELKMTLTWNNHADIDLHCVCPNGHHIYYGNTNPTGCEGYLDLDNIPGFGPGDPCKPENIYFASAPAGHYKVYIHYFGEKKGIRSVQYKVVVYKNGTGHVHTGTIAGQGSVITIEEFDFGTAPRLLMTPGYTIDWENLPAKTAV